MEIRESLVGYRRLFQNRNFGWFLGGRIVSTAGDNLYLVASMWLIFEMTGSTSYTALAAFLGRAPSAVSFLVGPVVDKYQPLKLLVGTELAQMAVVSSVPLVALLGDIDVAIVIGIVPLLAICNQMSKPAQKTVLPQLVDDTNLVKANSLFSLSYRGIQAVGKSVSGFLIAVVGAVSLYAVNAATFFVGAAVFYLLALRARQGVVESGDESSEESEESEPLSPRERITEYTSNLRQGREAVTGSTVRYVILWTAIGNFLYGITTPILPAFAATISGASSYGILYAGVGAGLFVGATVASFFEEYSFGTLAGFLFVVSGLSWLVGVFAGSFSLTVLFITASWAAGGVYNVLSVSVIQSGVPDDKLGRVTAISGSLSGVASATGYLVGGAVGELAPPTTVMYLTGFGLCILGTSWFLITSARGLPAVAAVSKENLRID